MIIYTHHPTVILRLRCCSTSPTTHDMINHNSFHPKQARGECRVDEYSRKVIGAELKVAQEGEGEIDLSDSGDRQAIGRDVVKGAVCC